MQTDAFFFIHRLVFFFWKIQLQPSIHFIMQMNSPKLQGLDYQTPTKTNTKIWLRDSSKELELTERKRKSAAKVLCNFLMLSFYYFALTDSQPLKPKPNLMFLSSLSCMQGNGGTRNDEDFHANQNSNQAFLKRIRQLGRFSTMNSAVKMQLWPTQNEGLHNNSIPSYQTHTNLLLHCMDLVHKIKE